MRQDEQTTDKKKERKYGCRCARCLCAPLPMRVYDGRAPQSVQPHQHESLSLSRILPRCVPWLCAWPSRLSDVQYVYIYIYIAACACLHDVSLLRDRLYYNLLFWALLFCVVPYGTFPSYVSTFYAGCGTLSMYTETSVSPPSLSLSLTPAPSRARFLVHLLCCERVLDGLPCVLRRSCAVKGPAHVCVYMPSKVVFFSCRFPLPLPGPLESVIYCQIYNYSCIHG